MSEDFQKLASALAESGEARFLIEHPELAEYVKVSSIDSTLFNIIDNHFSKYGKIPAKDVVVKEWGEALPKATEPPLYYLGLLRIAHIQKTLSTAASVAHTHMKGNAEQALSIMRKAVQDLDAAAESTSIMDYRKAGPMIMKHLTSKWSGNNYISMGWPSFDKNSGGLMGGDFISLMGFTGAGKTQLLLSRAFHFWDTHKLNVAFVSGEMNLAAILERAASLDAQVPADYMKHGLFPNIATTVDYKKKLLDRLAYAATAKNPLHFIDANLAMTEDDLLRLCSRLHLDVLCVDGAATLGGRNYRQRWEGIASFATFMKQAICQGLGIPVIASYQFTNEARKDFEKKHTKGGGRPTIANVAGSAEIGNLSSVALGMTYEDTPETINKRKVEILKGRGGESGNFVINWDWYKMEFGEYIEPAKQEKDDDDDLVLIGA